MSSILQVVTGSRAFDGQLGVYAAITPAAVLDAARRYLHGNPCVVTLVERDGSQPPFGALLLRSAGAP